MRPRVLGRFARDLTVLAIFSVVGAANASGQPTPGQNVNMVSGTQWPGGDPFLQRQNEPSLAVSTRNPLHLLAGANDYRTVDLPLQDAVPGEGLAGDAWLGVFKSFDGGQSWQSTLFPGYPQDLTPQGLASPMKGFTTAADPVVRAGTNGLFYYSGIAFNRGTNLGKVFASLWIDLANKENGDATSTPLSMNTDPIRYVRTVAIASGNAGQFLDKPWLAVDIPRAGAGICTIPVPVPGGGTVVQNVPAGNVYMSYSMFVGNTNNIRTKLYFTRSTDCGATWSTPTKLSEGYPVNQGTIIAVDPSTGYVYVAWRGFSTVNTANTITIVKSTDGGVTFTKGLTVVSLPDFDPSHPTAASFFDQGTTATTFRTNAFPALTVDGTGRVYLAWSQRDPSTNGDARIWMRTSPNGTTWSSPFLVDGAPVQDDFTGMFTRGHQFMPSMTFTGGKLAVLYYDQRLDHTVGQFFPNQPFSAANGHFYNEQRTLAGELVNPGGPAGVGLVFNPVLSDAGLTLRRHTLDLRVAEAAPSSAPFFSSSRVSQYKFGTLGDQQNLNLFQLQVNPPNLPMFQLGQVPFFGDYIDIAGLAFSQDSSGHWTYTTAPTAGTFHYASWTTNQDVVPPVDPVTHLVDWTKYTPPISAFNQGTGSNQSIFDPTQNVPPCSTPFTGSRNQNIYSSRITQGLLVSSPQSSKPLSAMLQRAFVVNVQNETAMDRSFRLSIPAGSQPAAPGYSSFTPGANNPGPPAAPPTPPAPLVTSLDVSVGAHAGVSRTLYAVSNTATFPISINVAEIDHPGGTIVAGGLASFLVLNADGTVPALADPDGAPAGTSIQTVEVYTPNVTNPNVTNPNVTNPNVTNVNTQNPNVTNPNVTNPNVTNPNVTNPNVTNPNVTNADIATPNVTNPNVTNPNVTNPNVTNPNVTNPNVTNPNVTNYPVADSTYTVSNGGNTTATYQVKLAKLGSQTISTPLQLLVNKSYATLASDNCYLFPQFQSTLAVNVTNPVFIDIASLGNATVNDPSVSNATFSLAPGETALVTLRGSFPAGTTDTQALQGIQQITQTAVVPVAVPAAPNTNDPTNTPKPGVPGGIFITTTSLPAVNVGQAYSQTLVQVGGVPPVTWSVIAGALPPGFALNSATGTITNATPAANVSGNYNFTVQAADAAAHVATRALTIAVNSLNLILLSQPSDSIGGQTISPVQVKVQDSSAAPIPGASVTIAIASSPCTGATLSGTTTITTNAVGQGSFSTLSIDRGAAGYTLQASLTAVPSVSSTTNPFRIEGFCGTPLPMTAARKWHTATRLANGKVLIAGGSNGAGALATAEIFDPATGAFTPTPGNMGVARAFHSATLLTDGTVLIVGGGSDFEAGTLASAERYDPATGLFTPTGGLTGHTRQMHGAVRLNDGRVLVAGGFTNDSGIGGLATAEVYNPGTGTFAATSGNMTHDRIGDFTTTLLADGRVLLAGGFRNLVGGSQADGELFDPVATTFSAAPILMNSRRGKHTANLQLNGQTFLAGGEDDITILNSTEYFDPVTSSFVVSLSSQPALLTARESHTGTRLSDERFLEAGGQTIVGGIPTPIASAEIYDPYGAVTGTGALTGPRQVHTATALPDGTVLVTGGTGAGGTVLSSAEIFHPNVYIADSPSFGLVNISNVQLNGGGNVLIQPGGGNVTLDHDYFISNPAGCPSCIQQIEVGLANGLYQACTYDSIPPVAGVSGHGTTVLAVPAASGRYYIGFDEAFTFFCHQFPAWWNGAPGTNRYMALVIVP